MAGNNTRGKLKIIATGSGRKIAERIAMQLKEYRQKEDYEDCDLLVNTNEVEFGDGEIKTDVLDSLRGADVYVIADCASSVHPHPTHPFTVDQNIRSLTTAISGSIEAKHITAVLPYFPYSRQDKRISREGITARDVAREIERVGTNQVITFDIHNPAIAGFFVNPRVTLENLLASKNIIDRIREYFDLDNLVICSPDAGGVKRAEHYCGHLGTNLAIIYKDRDYKNPGKINKMFLMGNVKDKEVLIVDDMVASGGTMEVALKTLSDAGAKSISYAVTHAILNRGQRDQKTGIPPSISGKDIVVKCHQEGLLDKFYFAEIIDHGQFFEKHKDFMVPVSVDKYLAKVIHHLNTEQSISALLAKDHVL
ncbi:ribose-phosphate pyrophosphokinase [Candidatus Woesearchaeota archaeon]|nr:ribose-phosphate pyrophosphokinase [Candidatus Woesearchaeota archaeon]